MGAGIANVRFRPIADISCSAHCPVMATFDSPQALADYLIAGGIDCSVSDDGFVELPVPDADAIATLRPEAGWVVFKLFVGDWSPGPQEAACRTLLLFQDRLIGFRFSVTAGEVWAVQDFLIEALGDNFHAYVHHALEMIETIIPALLPHLDSDRVISEDEIDAIFGLLEARALN